MSKKVYLVECDNGESYEDYRRWTEAVFKHKEDAEDYLRTRGWSEPSEDHRGKLRDYWSKEEDEGWAILCRWAWITPMPLR